MWIAQNHMLLCKGPFIADRASKILNNLQWLESEEENDRGVPFQNWSSSVSLAGLLDRVPACHVCVTTVLAQMKYNLKCSCSVRPATSEVFNRQAKMMEHGSYCRKLYWTALLKVDLKKSQKMGITKVQKWTYFWIWEIATTLLHSSTSQGTVSSVENPSFREDAVVGGPKCREEKCAWGYKWMVGSLTPATHNCMAFGKVLKPHDGISFSGQKQRKSRLRWRGTGKRIQAS